MDEKRKLLLALFIFSIISSTLFVMGVIPTQGIPTLDTTDSLTNNTNTNLTASNVSTSDADSDIVKNIYSWYINGVPFSVVNMPFTKINGSIINNTWDYSGNGNDGIVHGSATWGENNSFDNRGAYNFSGLSGEFINISKSGLTYGISKDFTLSAWVKINNTLKENAYVLSSGDVKTTGFFPGWAFYAQRTSGETDLLFGIKDGNGPIDTETSVEASNVFTINGKWIHVAVTVVRSGNAIIYVNGTSVVSGDISGQNLGAIDFDTLIGGCSGSGCSDDNWNGTIGEVMIFNRSLSTNQIWNLYTNKTNEISSNETVKGQYWNVTVTPNDANNDGFFNFTNTVLILNKAPSQGTPVLNTTNPTTDGSDTNLTAHNSTFDDDPDRLRSIFNWYKNGDSLTLVNMPFEKINRTTSDNAWDYSGLMNNGSEQGTPVWNATGGFDGNGAYEFDGIVDTIFIPKDESLSQPDTFTGNITLSSWIKTKDATKNQSIISNNNSVAGNFRGLDFYYGGDSTGKTLSFVMRFQESIGVYVTKIVEADIGDISDNWHHVAVRITKTDETVTVYHNGAQIASNDFSGLGGNSNILLNDNISISGSNNGIGGIKHRFNGTLDEVMIFNRSLSPEQIWNLYQNKTNEIVRNETTLQEYWNFTSTPNDGDEDGAVIFSNTILVQDLIVPNVTFTNPVNNSNLSTGIQSFNATIIELGSAINTVLFMFNSNTTPFNVTATTHASDGFGADVNISTIVEGNHSVTVFADDVAGNVNQTIFINITVDRTLPLIDITNPTITLSTRGNITANWTITEINARTCRYSVGTSSLPESEIGNTTVACSETNTTFDVSSDADFRFSVSVIDFSGNQNTSFSSFTVDTSTSIPSGGASGGTPSTVITTALPTCNIILNPDEVFIGTGKRLQEIFIFNEENSTYTPTFTFSTIEGQNDKRDQLSLTNVPGTILPSSSSSFGVEFTGGTTEQGKNNLIISSTNCADLVLPINVNIGIVGELLSEFFDPAKSLRENIVDLGLSSVSEFLPLVKVWMFFILWIVIMLLITSGSIQQNIKEEKRATVVGIILFNILISFFITLLLTAIIP